MTSHAKIIEKAVLTIQNGNAEEGKRLLNGVLLQPDLPSAARIIVLLWLAEVTTEPQKKLAFYQEALALAPENVVIKQRLALLSLPEGNLKGEILIDELDDEEFDEQDRRQREQSSVSKPPLPTNAPITLPEPAPTTQPSLGGKISEVITDFIDSILPSRSTSAPESKPVSATDDGVVVDVKKEEAPPSDSPKSSPPPPASSEPPDFDKMSIEDLMQWIESLAKRQGAYQVANSTPDGEFAPPSLPPRPAPGAPARPASPITREEKSVKRDDSLLPVAEEAEELPMRGGEAPAEPPFTETELGEAVATDRLTDAPAEINLPADGKPIEKPVTVAQDIQPAPVMFSAYPPKVAKKDEWQPLLAYVFRETAAQAVIADALKQLGEKQVRFSQVTTAAKKVISEGAEIVARPTMAGFQFKPLEVKIGFYDDWQRFNFELRAKDAPLNKFATGNITFTVEGLIVADVPLSVYVGDESAAGEISSTVTRMYQAIFCSYSHDDTKIVERVERAYKALGLDYLRDITTLKSGTEWSEELLKLIDRADIFQLFWSKAAAESPYVKKEWEHALTLDHDSSNFIRPVYWQQPIPHVPDALRHIHFGYQPDLDD